MSESKHSIVVVDKHPIILQGVKALLSTRDDLEILAATTTSSEIFELPESIGVDLVIIDLAQVESDAVGFITQIKVMYPVTGILNYTTLEEERFFATMAGMGVTGCLSKKSSSSKLLEAVRCVLDGGTYYPPHVSQRFRHKTEARAGQDIPSIGNLTRREMEVFVLMGEGLDTAKISSKLYISPNTVDTHRINIRKKLGVLTYKELYRLAYCSCHQDGSGSIGSCCFLPGLFADRRIADYRIK